MTLEQIARVCHAANAAYAETLSEVSLPFEKVCDSIISGVEAIIKDPSMTPEESHRRWYAWKEKEGWRYGIIKDAEAKTHPQMVPYAELGEEQRLKDYLFHAIVRVLARLPKGYVIT